MLNQPIISIKEHPDYEQTIEDVVNKNTNPKVMEQAKIKAKRETQAEALYVLLSLAQE